LDSASREVDRTLDAKDDKNNNLCGARYPNGKDLNSDLDWNLQETTPRTSNRGSSVDIYAGKSMCLLFNLIGGSIELELCIACAWPKGTEHPLGHSGIHPEQLLLLSSPLSLTPRQEICQLSKLGARTAIRKHPDLPRGLAVGEVATYEISVELPNETSKLWINDTIPQGLIYNESSLCVQGPSLQQELIAANSDGSWQICWFFGDADPAQTIEIAYDCLLENALDNQD
jgi:hypothetical protein